MMDFLRQWILSLTCGGMIVAIAEQLTPEGSTKKVVRLICGLVLLIAVVRPVLELDYGTLASAVAWSKVDIEVDLAQANQDLLKTIIGEETGAYILDKASQLGLSCDQVAVICRVGEEGLCYPSEVTIVGELDQEQRLALTRLIEADLAIPAQAQTYEDRGEGQ